MNRSRVSDTAECAPEVVINHGQGFADSLHVNSLQLWGGMLVNGAALGIANLCASARALSSSSLIK